MRLLRRALHIFRHRGPVAFSREVTNYLVHLTHVLVNLVVTATATRVLSRETGVWVFGTPNGTFVQNSKYLYLYVCQNCEDIRAIWVSKDRRTVRKLNDAGYEAYYAYSLSGLAAVARAESVFYSNSRSDLGFWGLLGGSTTVNLWHGNPIKEFRVSNWPTSVERSADYHVVTSSKEPMELFAEVPWTDENFETEQALPSGYPRNDVLFEDIPDANLCLDTDEYERVEHLAESYTLFGYFPTFRPYPEKNPIFDDEETARRLDELLRATDSAMLLKHHPSREVNLNATQFDRIYELSSDFDIYPILGFLDVVVTDYSSVYYGFLLLDRPQILFPYDRQQYDREYGFQYDYDNFPEPKANDVGELFEWIEYFAAGHDRFSESRRKIRARFYDEIDGEASRRVVEAVRERR